MDESGKGMLNQKNQDVFIFGGMVIDKDHVYDAINDFKKIYQKNRNLLKKYLNQQINTADKAQRIHHMINKFEFHAAEIFNPDMDQVRKNKIIKENPWKYYPVTARFKLINEILSTMKKYMSRIYMFKVNKLDFLSHCTNHGLNPCDTLLNEKMADFILMEFDNWLKEESKRGAIIPDRLDSEIRDIFVEKIKQYSPDHLWTEPIIVESYSNAFTQIIDIITYCYYMVYKNTTHKTNFKSVQKAYNIHIDKLVVEKDLYKNLI